MYSQDYYRNVLQPILVLQSIELEYLVMLINKLTLIKFSGTFGDLMAQQSAFNNAVSLYGQMHRN